MKTDLDFTSPELFGSVVFRPSFNSFQIINPTQAWSLLFTGGQEDKALGDQGGSFFTNLLIAIVVSGVLGTLILQSSLLG
ncbi:MAG: hypothetical protein DSM106950_30250 [Stigonema ocellatum SAG 48.90 = DSM 106950]|nr:hypothetical protein [Stigonema ocellatum SAG 48.90 = DSM 106950]